MTRCCEKQGDAEQHYSNGLDHHDICIAIFKHNQVMAYYLINKNDLFAELHMPEAI
jgi:hypothetical protein